MHLNEALARLSTDATARGRFLADPDGWLDTTELAPRDRASLAALPREALARYATSLLDKRAAELVQAIPWTARLFPPVRSLYRAWLARHPAPATDDVLSPGLREALRALPVLAEAIEPEWVGELFVYEVLSRCSRRDGRRRRLAARWPQHELVEAIEGGEVPLDPDEQHQVYTFP